MRRWAAWVRHFDKMLFLTPIGIFVIGFLSIFSASFQSSQPLREMLVTKQLLWMGIAVLAVIWLSRLSYFRLQDAARPVYALCLFLLVVVLFMPARLGAHRWIGIGGFNIQPSELAKLSLVLLLADYFAQHRLEHCTRVQKIVPFLLTTIPFALIVKEPDLGSGLTLVPVFAAMLYGWGCQGRKLIQGGALALCLSPLFFFFLKEYQKARLLVFLDPNMDPLGAGYTIIQSKIAIGSGGWIGKGFLGGTQNRLNFIPERHTDFIFAVIAEEGGFVAAILVLLLFWVIVRKGLTIAKQTPDRFGSQLALGLSVLIGAQAIINLSMSMGLLPVVGIPLPLVSYGGSSILTTMSSIGILLSIKIHRPLF